MVVAQQGLPRQPLFFSPSENGLESNAAEIQGAALGVAIGGVLHHSDTLACTMPV